MLFGILLTIQVIICISMSALILLQRSEGGALGMGGGPSGFMSARGAGNLLTRATGILAVAFFACAIAMTVVGNLDNRKGSVVDKIDTSGLTVDRTGQPQQPAAAASSSSVAPSLADLPLAGSTPVPSSSAAPASTSASRSASASSKPAAALPAPLKPSASSSSSVSPQQVNQAKSSIWQGSSSSAPAKPAPAATAPASSASSTSSAPK